MEPTWTISELAAAAAAALGDAPARVNGRVRDLPNERLIRWYTTIGLLDPPSGRRGRTALYGERHLLQLVAVKRRQAAGRTIAQIQAELVGATNTTLRAIARLPGTPAATAADHSGRRQPADEPGIAATDRPGERAEHASRRRSSARPRPGTPPEQSIGLHTADAPGGPAEGGEADVRWQREAAERPARGRFWAQSAPAGSSSPGAPTPSVSTADLAPVSGVRLAPGVSLIIDIAGLTHEDVRAIGEAAEPLLAELRRRGLTSDAPSFSAPASPSDPNGRLP
ncbi:MerR family transcriptional regulator [Thermomonospora cellulosilytica]|uniref:DNA-binding transcriptional MerR regulator n=1 Tax=Thermomonospora cellulosilytica TaxID=1411118 RepID=A0A7W3MTE3_9ACTN|nr:MerR family transcriptional regulator [Thermomonospora cellulosilytica]MBA9001518.1 DNA-binding transcriptional MerR regulator [Thermomonospora cellulosilytica]